MRQVKLNGQMLTVLEPGDDGYTEPAAVASQTSGDLTIRVSEKRAVSVYGLQRFPVTLYAEQWRKLLAAAPDILAFINRTPNLSFKQNKGR